MAQKPELNSAEKEAMAQMRSGNLVSDELIYQLAFNEIEKSIADGKGVVLDGAIRNLEQAQGFQNFFKEQNLTDEVLALDIALDDKDSFDRLTKRRVCTACGEIVPWLPATKSLTACPKCSGKLETRQDDDEKIIKERIVKQGNIALAPIINFYKNLGALAKINGNQAIEDVEKDIANVLS